MIHNGKNGGESWGKYTESFSLEIGFEQLWDRLRKLNVSFLMTMRNWANDLVILMKKRGGIRKRHF